METRSFAHALNWMVLTTHAHSEEFAIENLVRQDYEAYCPMIVKRIKHARRAYDAKRPLFPGFCSGRYPSPLRSGQLSQDGALSDWIANVPQFSGSWRCPLVFWPEQEMHKLGSRFEGPALNCLDGPDGSGCFADQTFQRRYGVSKLVLRFKKPPCATALLGGQFWIAGKLKDRLGKPGAIAVADDEPGCAVSYNTGQFALRMTDKNCRAASSCDAIIFARDDQAFKIGLQTDQMHIGC